jgi:hypothetical protein
VNYSRVQPLVQGVSLDIERAGIVHRNLTLPGYRQPVSKEKAMRRYIAIIAAAAFPTAAHANTDASAGVRISLVVPEICQIESPTITVDASGETASGTVFEMCNSGRGFRVMASHRVLAEGEQVQINYAGQIRQLDSSGMSDVAHRSGPTVGNVPVTIQTNGLVQNLAISLGLAAI